RWQGATMRNSWRYCEEEQRSQRRRDTAEFGDGLPIRDTRTPTDSDASVSFSLKARKAGKDADGDPGMLRCSSRARRASAPSVRRQISGACSARSAAYTEESVARRFGR